VLEMFAPFAKPHVQSLHDTLFTNYSIVGGVSWAMQFRMQFCSLYFAKVI